MLCDTQFEVFEYAGFSPSAKSLSQDVTHIIRLFPNYTSNSFGSSLFFFRPKKNVMHNLYNPTGIITVCVPSLFFREESSHLLLLLKKKKNKAVLSGIWRSQKTF